MAQNKSKNPKIKIEANMSGAEEWKEWCKQNTKNDASKHGTAGALYFVGFVGALVYWM